MSKPGEFAGQFDGSVHAPTPEPDPEGAKVHTRDASGNLVEARPEHHVDPLAKTEAVAGSAAPTPTVEADNLNKSFLERLRGMPRDNAITVHTSGGHQCTGHIVEVTDEVIVLKREGGDVATTILLDRIDLFYPYG